MAAVGRTGSLGRGARILRAVLWVLLLTGWMLPALPADRPTTPPTRPAPEPREPEPLPRERAEPGETSTHINLSRMAAAMGLERRWDRENRQLVLTSGRAAPRLEFEGESRAFRFNGIRVFLGEAVASAGDSLYLSRIDYRTMVLPLLSPGAAPAPGNDLRTIVIDPGHGGRDPGTKSRELGLAEKDLTLDVSFRLRDLLAEAGYRVVLTRQDDRYVPLEQRTVIANRAGADLFISIHFNAVENPSVSGTETFILTPRHHRSTGQGAPRSGDGEELAGNRFDHWNALIGFYVQRQLLHDLGSFDRGIKRARFSVLREVSCPAVLVEAGYLSNTREARRIASAEYRQRLARSLAAAVGHYQNTLSRVSEQENSF